MKFAERSLGIPEYATQIENDRDMVVRIRVLDAGLPSQETRVLRNGRLVTAEPQDLGVK